MRYSTPDDFMIRGVCHVCRKSFEQPSYDGNPLTGNGSYYVVKCSICAKETCSECAKTYWDSADTRYNLCSLCIDEYGIEKEQITSRFEPIYKVLKDDKVNCGGCSRHIPAARAFRELEICSDCEKAVCSSCIMPEEKWLHHRDYVLKVAWQKHLCRKCFDKWERIDARIKAEQAAEARGEKYVDPDDSDYPGRRGRGRRGRGSCQQEEEGSSLATTLLRGAIKLFRKL